VSAPWRLFQGEGVRGIYLNELGRAEAGKIAAAFAARVWKQSGASVERTEEAGPPVAMLPEEGLCVEPVAGQGPSIVLATDERPSSPELAVAAAAMLRRAGCQVIDIGATTRPCFWYAVNVLGAAGGLHVTGNGCTAAMTGFDFVVHGARPCSSPGLLDGIREAHQQAFPRTSRPPGSQRLFRALPSYEACLRKHFHALRPLRVGFACGSRLVGDQFGRIFRGLACQLHVVPCRPGARDDPAVEAGNARRLSAEVRERGLHLGVLVGDDGQQFQVLDEEGQSVPCPTIARLLAGVVREEQQNAPPFSGVDEPRAPASIASPALLPTTLESAWQAMRDGGAPMGSGPDGYYWFVDPFLTCDAALSLARLMQALSRQDMALSEVVEKLA
jgi:phosphomannomutase